MPPSIASIVIFVGAGIAAFGAVVATMDRSPSEIAPRVSLAPVTPSDNRPASDEVRGVILDADGESVSDVRVELTPLFEAAGTQPRSAETDADGRFVFSDVDVTPGTPYVVDASFDGVTFSSEMLRVARDSDNPVRIVVAQTTKQPDGIELDVESIALVGDERGAQAVHALTVRNRSDRAYAGRLRLPLLAGANAIDPRIGLDRRFLELHTGELISTKPIPPGRLDISYTYVAPMPRRGLRVSRTVAYPTKRFELLIGGELGADTAAGVEPAGDVTLGPRGEQRTYDRFEASELDVGQTLSAQVAVGRSSPVLRIAGLVAAGVAAATIVALPLVRRRRSSRANSERDAPLGAAPHIQ